MTQKTRSRKLFPENIQLNVGGSYFCTSIFTLTKYADSLLGRCFSGRETLAKDGQGRYFIDRDGALFSYILDYLRSGQLIVPREFNEYNRLRYEAEFYQLKELEQLLRVQGYVKETNARSSYFITLHVRSSYAFGRCEQADVAFRKMKRILICGQAALCREVFGEDLNDTRDPNPDGVRYTSRFFLKHAQVEKAFRQLQDQGFYLVSSCAGGGGQDDTYNDEETKWNHFNMYIFFREKAS